MLPIFRLITIYMRKTDKSISGGVKITQGDHVVFPGFAIKQEGLEYKIPLISRKLIQSCASMENALVIELQVDEQNKKISTEIR